MAMAVSAACGLPFIKGVTRRTEDRGTGRGQASILMDYIEEFSKNGCSWVCDRTIIDVCSYSLLYGVWTEAVVHDMIEAWLRKPYAPTMLVYTPIEFPMIQDGNRPPEETREELDKWIRQLIVSHSCNHIVVSGSVVERLKQIESHLYAP